MKVPREVYARIILAHAIPLVGVLLGQWDFLALIFAYWVETYIICLVLTYIFLLMRKVMVRANGLAVPLNSFLIGFAIFTVIQLVLLALLLKAVAAFLSPGRSEAPLTDLFRLFLVHISQFNFLVYAFIPICLTTGLNLLGYISSKAYRQSAVAAKAVEDLLWRIFIHFILILALAIKVSKGVVDSLVIVLGFFLSKAVVELLIYKERRTKGSEASKFFEDLLPAKVFSDIERAQKSGGLTEKKHRFRSRLSRHRFKKKRNKRR
jgi:hypothetical protein